MHVRRCRALMLPPWARTTGWSSMSVRTHVTPVPASAGRTTIRISLPECSPMPRYSTGFLIVRCCRPAGVGGVATTALLAPSFRLLGRLRRLRRLGWRVRHLVLLERHLQQLDEVARQVDRVVREPDLAYLEHLEALLHLPELPVGRLVGIVRRRPRIVDAHDEVYAAVLCDLCDSHFHVLVELEVHAHLRDGER